MAERIDSPKAPKCQIDTLNGTLDATLAENFRLTHFRMTYKKGLQYLPEEADISDYKIVSFDTMLRMNKRSEWNNLFKQVVDKNVCIKDDVLMENDEMKSYKD